MYCTSGSKLSFCPLTFNRFYMHWYIANEVTLKSWFIYWVFSYNNTFQNPKKKETKKTFLPALISYYKNHTFASLHLGFHSMLSFLWLLHSFNVWTVKFPLKDQQQRTNDLEEARAGGGRGGLCLHFSFPLFCRLLLLHPQLQLLPTSQIITNSAKLWTKLLSIWL